MPTAQNVGRGPTAVESFNIDLLGESVPSTLSRTRWTRPAATPPPCAAIQPILAWLYPIENQLADKLRVLDARYGSGPSVRYRDLCDRAMMVDQLTFDR